MAVNKSERSVSGAEFLKVLRDLEVYLIRICDKSSKKHKFFKDEFLIKTAAGALSYAKAGNSVKVVYDDDYFLRRKYFQMSLSNIQALISQLDVLMEIFPDNGITENQLKEVSSIMKHAFNLLNRLILNEQKSFEEGQ